MEIIMLTGYKTYIAAALVAAFGVLAMTDWVSFLSNPSAGATALVTSLIFAVLRAVTNGPGGVQIVFKKPDQLTDTKTQ
jgi:hypothetical protein